MKYLFLVLFLNSCHYLSLPSDLCPTEKVKACSESCREKVKHCSCEDKWPPFVDCLNSCIDECKKSNRK